MLHAPRTIKILLLCFAMYMLMVLPVFADGVYKMPTPHSGQQGYMAPPPPAQYAPAPNTSVAPMRTMNPNAYPEFKTYEGSRPRYTAPMPAPHQSYGPEESIWMREGGARLQYDALSGPTQMYTNGRPVLDPANVHLPPLHPDKLPKAQTKRTRQTRAQSQPITVEPPLNRAWKLSGHGKPAMTSPKPAPTPKPTTAAPPAAAPAPKAVTQDSATKPTAAPTTPKITNDPTPTGAPTGAPTPPAANPPAITPKTGTAMPYDGPANPVGGNTVEKINP